MPPLDEARVWEIHHALNADDFCGTGGVASQELEAGCVGGGGAEGTCGDV